LRAGRDMSRYRTLVVQVERERKGLVEEMDDTLL
jgi:hypothetical protein